MRSLNGADLLGKGMLRLEEMLEPNSAVYRSGGVVESTTTCPGGSGISHIGGRGRG